MAIKKQSKRPLEATAPAQNGAEIKKSQKPSKKPKLEKPISAQNNGVLSKKPQKAEKSKIRIVKVEEVKQKPKQTVKAPSAEAPLGSVAKQEAKKLKNAAKLAKKNENRKVARKEQGQFKPELVKMSATEIQTKIDAITSRPALSKSAKRKLSVFRKRLQIIEGTYVPKPRPETSDLTKSVRRHRRAALRNAKRRAANDTEKKNVSAEGSTSVVAEPAVSTKQKVIVAAPQSGVKKEKLAKASKQQQPKGKEAKKLIAKMEEPEESEEEEEEEEDSDEEVNTSAASFMNTTEEEDEEEDDDDEEEDEEVGSPVKRVKEEPVKKAKQETEKKPFVKKENAKNGPAANGDSQDGKKKRFVLFVGNLSFESSADDIKKHFLTKVNDVTDVRVPLRPGTTSPRGFAYVEVSNPTDYEKALSLHGTNLNGRRLKVEYTQGGSKSTGNRSDVISKNKKLHAMRKQGMLAGSRKEGNNRNDRRQKAKQHGGA